MYWYGVGRGMGEGYIEGGSGAYMDIDMLSDMERGMHMCMCMGEVYGEG